MAVGCCVALSADWETRRGVRSRRVMPLHCTALPDDALSNTVRVDALGGGGAPSRSENAVTLRVTCSSTSATCNMSARISLMREIIQQAQTTRNSAGNAGSTKTQWKTQPRQVGRLPTQDKCICAFVSCERHTDTRGTVRSSDWCATFGEETRAVSGCVGHLCARYLQDKT